MFGLSVFLKALGTAVLKWGLNSAGLKIATAALELVTVYELTRSITDCGQLGVAGFEFGYQLLNDSAVDYLANSLVTDRYCIERTASGLFVANTRVIPGRIYLGTERQYPLFNVPLVTAPLDTARLD